MPRTTAKKVEGVLGVNYDAARYPSLVPFIDSAAVITNRVATCATEKKTPLTDAELELVERWLAGHYYQKSDRGYASSNTEGASASFDGKTGMYFESTLYGQTAIEIDPSGCLKDLQLASTGAALRPVASASWLGKRSSEQIPVWQRE